MVKVFDTNTRPAGFTEDQPIIDALEMGFELGCENEMFYLRYNGLESYLKEGDEIKGEYKRNFLRGYNPYHSQPGHGCPGYFFFSEQKSKRRLLPFSLFVFL